MLNKSLSRAMWIVTIAVVAVSAIQMISGNWVVFYLLWPGGPSLGDPFAFMRAMGSLAYYHRVAGFVIAGLAIVILILAFASKWNRSVRIAAIGGVIVAGLAAQGGIGYIGSGLEDRWELGKMADAAVGVISVYLIQMMLMKRTAKTSTTGENTLKEGSSEPAGAGKDSR